MVAAVTVGGGEKEVVIMGAQGIEGRCWQQQGGIWFFWGCVCGGGGGGSRNKGARRRPGGREEVINGTEKLGREERGD